MEKFHDSKQILELKDSIQFGSGEIIVITQMLEEPKVSHGIKFWFQTSVIEASEGKIIFAKLKGQYINALEAIQGHQLALSTITELVNRAEAVFKPSQETCPPEEPVAEIPLDVKPQKRKKEKA